MIRLQRKYGRITEKKVIEKNMAAEEGQQHLGELDN